jgi:hypothetical protein
LSVIYVRSAEILEMVPIEMSNWAEHTGDEGNIAEDGNNTTGNRQTALGSENEAESALLRSSSSSPKPTKQQQLPSRWQLTSLDTWSWEFLSLGLSILCFVAIFILLLVYNGKASPQFPHGLTLNAIVSVLATGTKSSLIFVTSTAIGQLKWSWFRRRRQLHDIQLFDDASRGPLGSMAILFRRRTWSLVSLGAFITILALAFDPFMQQLLSYPIRQTSNPSGMATLKRCNEYRTNIPDDLGVRHAINAGIWTDDFEVSPICESGNCTWPAFKFMGLCSKCEDITSTARLEGCTDVSFDPNKGGSQYTQCTISLARGGYAFVNITSSAIGSGFHKIYVPKEVVWIVDSLGIGLKEASYVGVDNPLQVIAHASLRLPHEKSVSSHPENGLKLDNVTQCVLSMCTREYEISVSKGRPVINVTSVDFGKMMVSPNKSDGICWVPGSATIPPSDDSVNSTQFAVCKAEFLGGNVSPSPLVGKYFYNWLYSDPQHRKDGELPWVMLSVGTEETDQSTISDDFDNVLNTTLETTLHNIAASLTKLGRDRSNVSVDGIVCVSEVYVSVDWAWLALPVMVLLLTFVFLILTLLANKRHENWLWKASILPVLYHGLDEGVLSDGNEYATVSCMEASAQTVEVELQSSDPKGRLMFRQ